MDFRNRSWYILVCAIAVAGQLNPCYFWPESVYVNGKCFVVLAEPGSFDTAKEKCAKFKNGLVAEIKSQREKTVLLSLMHRDQVYIGLTDEVKEGSYLWNSDKTPLNLSATPLDIQCPSTLNAGEADCVVMDLRGVLSCMDCEWDIISIACQLDVGNPCDLYLPGAEYNKGSCFLYVENSLQLDGQELCEEKGAFLVEPKSSEMLEYIHDFATRHTAGSNSSVYGIRIGAAALTPGNWTWITSGENITLQPWISNEPNQLRTERSAAMLRGANWRWNNVQNVCFMPFVCQKDIGDPCEQIMPGGIFTFGACVKFINNRLSWQSAKAACEDNGWFLAEPKTKKLSDSLINYYLFTTGNSMEQTWLGGAKEPGDRWSWVTSKEPVTYKSWIDGEPNNAVDALGPENVMVLYHTTSLTIGWNDISEKHLWSYMCQTDVPITRSQSYLAVIPPQVEDTPDLDDVKMYVTTGLRSRLVYLKFVTSSGRVVRASVSDTRHCEFILQKEDRQVGPTGLYTDYVLIEATDDVTVVLHMHSSMTPIYPVNWSTGLSYIIHSGPSEESENSSAAVVALTNIPSDVTFYLSQGSQNVKLDISQITVDNLKYPSTVSARLTGKFHILSMDNVSACGGSVFLDSVYQVAAFARTQAGMSQGLRFHKYHQVLPVHLLGNEYVVFPSLPSRDGRSLSLKVIAVHDDTQITISGSQSNINPLAINLGAAGDTTVVSLAADTFYVVSSSDTFYALQLVTFVDELSPQSCMTPLLPRHLWRTQYDFTMEFADTMADADIVIVTVVETLLAANVVMFPGSHLWTCVDVSDNSIWTGCYTRLPAVYNTGPYYHIYLQNHESSSFGAYLMNRGGLSSTCYPLGVATEPHMASTFNKDTYYQPPQDDTPCPFFSSTTPDFSTTMRDYPETTTTYMEPIVDSNLSLRMTSPMDTAASTFGITTDISSPLSSAYMINSNPTTTTATATTAPAKTPITTLLDVTQVYNSKADFRMTLSELHIDRKNTLSYKRSKCSIDDQRMSAAAIGATGVTIVIAVIAVIVMSDLISFCSNSAKYGCYRTDRLRA